MTTATDTNNLPLVLYKADLCAVLRKQVRTIERLDRAGRLPTKIPLPGRPCWSRDTVLRWLSGRR